MDIFMTNSFALSNDLFLFVIAQLLLWKRKISFSCSHKIISTRLLFRFISVNLHLHGIQVSSAPSSCLDAVLILFPDSVQYFSDDCIQGRFSPDGWRLYWSCKHWNFHEKQSTNLMIANLLQYCYFANTLLKEMPHEHFLLNFESLLKILAIVINQNKLYRSNLHNCNYCITATWCPWTTCASALLH